MFDISRIECHDAWYLRLLRCGRGRPQVWALCTCTDRAASTKVRRTLVPCSCSELINELICGCISAGGESVRWGALKLIWQGVGSFEMSLMRCLGYSLAKAAQRETIAGAVNDVYWCTCSGLYNISAGTSGAFWARGKAA